MKRRREEHFDLLKSDHSDPNAAKSLRNQLKKRNWTGKSSLESGRTAQVLRQLSQEFNVGVEWQFSVVEILLQQLLVPCCVDGKDDCYWQNEKSADQMDFALCSERWRVFKPHLLLLMAQLPPQQKFQQQRQLLKYFQLVQFKPMVCSIIAIRGLLQLILLHKGNSSVHQLLMINASLLLVNLNDSGITTSNIFHCSTATSFLDEAFHSFLNFLRDLQFKHSTSLNTTSIQSILAVIDSIYGSSNSTKISLTSQPLVLMCSVLNHTNEQTFRPYFVNTAAEFLLYCDYDYQDWLPTYSISEHFCKAKKLKFLMGYCSHLSLVNVHTVLKLLMNLVVKIQSDLSSVDELKFEKFSGVMFCVLYIFSHRYCKDLQKLQDVQLFKSRLLSLLNILFAKDSFHIPFSLYAFYLATCCDYDFVSIERIAHGSWRKVHAEALDWDSVPFASLYTFPKVYEILHPYHIVSKLPQFELVLFENISEKLTPKDTVVGETTTSPLDNILCSYVLKSIFSYLSAKRLCRLATVCSIFSEASKSNALWEPLYTAAYIFPTKSKIKQKVICNHPKSFTHNYKQMFKYRYTSTISLKYKKTGAICCHCSCAKFCSTKLRYVKHLQAHKANVCEEVSCRSSFSTKKLLKMHMAAHRK